jgi:hypothetical protein
MPISLRKPGEGSVGWAGDYNQNFTDIENAINGGGGGGGSSKRHREGLTGRRNNASSIKVTKGSCRDSTNTTQLTLDDEVTVDNNTAGALGSDEKTSAATANTTSGSQTITTSQSIIAEIGTRTGTGTISTSGTTATGSGTKFLTELAVGDDIGTDTTYGFSRVTAIASDTSATIVAALPGGNAPASTSYKIIENGTLQPVTSGEKVRINTISASGTTIVAASNFSVTATGQQLRLGTEAVGTWLFAWIRSGSSGTTVALSTQRTTPYAMTGYDTAFRLIFSIRSHSGSALMEAFQREVSGPVADTFYEEPEGGNDTAVLAGGTATSWTDVALNAVVPPTARQAFLEIVNFKPTTESTIYVREQSIGSSTTSRNARVSAIANSINSALVVVNVNSSQRIQYAFNTAPGSAAGYIRVRGYRETL